MKLFLRAALAATLAFAQDQGFEVASIKPSRDRNAESNIDSTPGGRLTCTAVTVRELIRLAYGVKDYQIERAPGWVDSDRFDIAAKAEGGKKASYEDLQAQVRGLLTSRFQLSARRETKEGQVYLLTVAKNGPKLPAHNEGTGSRSRTACGHLSGMRLSMDVIATVLSRQFERDVLNRTALPGKYDFDLTWTPDAGPCPGGAEGLPSVFTAIQEQLGLKLESAKAPMETLVIDRVERPSEN